jgi:hypothetical protein
MITSTSIPSNYPVITVGGEPVVNEVVLTAMVEPALGIQLAGQTLIKVTPSVFPVDISTLLRFRTVSAWVPNAKVPALVELLKRSSTLTLYGHLGSVSEFCVDTFALVGDEGPQHVVRLSGAIAPGSRVNSELKLTYLAGGMTSVADLSTQAEPRQGTMGDLAVVEGCFVADTLWIRPGGLRISCPLSRDSYKAPVKIDGLDMPNRVTLVSRSIKAYSSFRYGFDMGSLEPGHDILVVYEGNHEGVGKRILEEIDQMGDKAMALDITGYDDDILSAERPLRPARDGEVSELQVTGFVEQVRDDAVVLEVLQDFPWRVKTFACMPDAGIFEQVKPGQLLTLTCHRQLGAPPAIDPRGGPAHRDRPSPHRLTLSVA